VRASASLRWHGALSCLVGALACGQAGEGGASPALVTLGGRPGYPATTSRLTSSLGGNLLKLCHATLVHPAWALTAGHCFSGVEPGARGALPDFARGFSADEIEFYPGAHRSSATRLNDVWAREDFIAESDLALVPLEPPVDDVSPVARWQPSDACALRRGTGVIGEFGLQGRDGQAWTADTALQGPVDAASLLGPGHPGWLVSAQGPGVGPGDSGSGVTATWESLETAAPGCELAGEDDPEHVLVGVVQDANPQDPSAAFGLVPVYRAEHARWLAAVLDATPPPRSTEPPVLPP